MKCTEGWSQSDYLQEIDELCDHLDGVYNSILGFADGLRDLAESLDEFAETVQRNSKTFEVFQEYLDRPLQLPDDLDWKDANEI